jgi:beta-glucanase (GH16 family)
MISCKPPAEPVVPDHDDALPAHVLSDYRLVFEDNFSGQTALDPAKWNTAYAWGPDTRINLEEQYYVDTLGGAGDQPTDPFSFTGEALRIEAAPWQPGVDGKEFTSGVITTRETCAFKYGYIEVCAKNPCCPSGMWTAIWLLNAFYYDNAFQKNQAENNGVGNDKFNNEIDFEFVDNFGCDQAVSKAMHYYTGDRNSSDNYSLWTLDGASFKQINLVTSTTTQDAGVYRDCAGELQTRLDATEGLSCEEFHTYGFDWRPGRLDIYVDGVRQDCVSAAFGGDIIPDQFMYLLINFAVGGAFPFANTGGGIEKADAADYPAALEVKTARIFLAPEGETTKETQLLSVETMQEHLESAGKLPEVLS